MDQLFVMGSAHGCVLIARIHFLLSAWTSMSTPTDTQTRVYYQMACMPSCWRVSCASLLPYMVSFVNGVTTPNTITTMMCVSHRNVQTQLRLCRLSFVHDDLETHRSHRRNQMRHKVSEILERSFAWKNSCRSEMLLIVTENLAWLRLAAIYHARTARMARPVLVASGTQSLFQATVTRNFTH